MGASVDYITGLFNELYYFFYDAFVNFGLDGVLDTDFNIYLFSSSGWFSPGISIGHILQFIFVFICWFIFGKFILKIIKLPFRIFK